MRPARPRPAEGPGERPQGWTSRLSARNSATIARHRGVSPLKGAPYCSPLYLAELFVIFFFLFPGSSLPQLASVLAGFRHSLGATLPGASLLPVSGRKTGLNCFTPRPCSRGGRCATGGGHMRISRLEPRLWRSPPTPDSRPRAPRLRQRPCNNKRRLLFTAAGDSFFSLHQLVSFNALLFPLNENLSLF